VTHIAVHPAPGRARLTVSEGQISPRIIRVTATGARIGLVATGALLLGGDHVEFDIDVGPGMWLELVETAGTVAYDAGAIASSWTVRIRVATGGVLLWAGEPFVVAQGANVHRRSVIDLAGTAVACLRETLVLGRTGETGGSLRSTLSVRLDGRLLAIEDLDLTSADHRSLPGVIGTARIIDTVALLGRKAPVDPALPPGSRFDLDGPGTLARCLTTSFAESPMGPIVTAWTAAAREETVSAATTS
jgi:urease accessory protein